MSLETITLTLPISTVERMRELVSSGEFQSLEYVVLCAFDKMEEPETDQAFDAELRESVRLFDEAKEAFEEMLSVEQMRAVLEKNESTPEMSRELCSSLFQAGPTRSASSPFLPFKALQSVGCRSL